MSSILALLLILVPRPMYAQYWHTLPSIQNSPGPIATFSDDGKKVFFLKQDNGIGNVWSMVIADKYGGIIAGKNPPMQVTHFTDRSVARFLHLLNKPDIVFMRLTPNGKDYHIYLMKDDGSGDMQDLTSGADGITNEMIGASNNGWYIYYTSNAVNHDKLDLYRYDTRQYTSDVVFPNDKDYRVLSWTKDQTKLLIEDPSTQSLILYDIESTARSPVPAPKGSNADAALLDPNASNIQTAGGIDYSVNDKYSISGTPGKWTVQSVAPPNTPLPLPAGAEPLAFSPKETLLLYRGGPMLSLYDIAKNTSTPLATVQ